MKVNRKGNEVARQTEERVETVFLGLLKDMEYRAVTVTRLCREARIHRTTFYDHYQDLDDLREKALRRFSLKLMQGFESEEGFSFRRGFENLFETVRDNQALFQDGHVDPAFLIQNAEENLFPLWKEPIERLAAERGVKTSAQLKYRQSFFIGGICQMMISWIRSGCDLSPEELTSIIHQEYLAQSDASSFRPGKSEEADSGAEDLDLEDTFRQAR